MCARRICRVSTDDSQQATGLPGGPSAEDRAWVCGPWMARCDAIGTGGSRGAG